MSKVRKWLTGSNDIIPEDVIKRHNKSTDQLEELTERIASMRDSFTNGGSIGFDDLSAYIVSTPETPIRYETGDRCYAYRLPCPDPDRLLFYCEFEPTPGNPAAYGWHNHPDCDEEVTQLTGKGFANGKTLGRFATTKFPAGKFHNYKMRQPGAILVTFIRVHK